MEATKKEEEIKTAVVSNKISNESQSGRRQNVKNPFSNLLQIELPGKLIIPSLQDSFCDVINKEELENVLEIAIGKRDAPSPI